jgi:ribosome-associated toxin RatA of RatAB toxin-antitoxin module
MIVMTYWNKDPKVRDVFEGLLSEIQGMRIAITPQVQCDRVAECVARARRREGQCGFRARVRSFWHFIQETSQSKSKINIKFEFGSKIRIKFQSTSPSNLI